MGRDQNEFVSVWYNERNKTKKNHYRTHYRTRKAETCID